MCGLDLSLHSTLVTHFPCVIYVHPEQARASGAFLVTTKQSGIKDIFDMTSQSKYSTGKKNFMNKWKV